MLPALLLACAHPVSPTADVAVPPPEEAGPPAPYIPTGDTPEPGGGPVLDRAGSDLDIQTMARSTVKATIQVDTAGLASVGPDNREAVLDHLAADPRWRVDADGMACLRVKSDGWTLPASTYHSGPSALWRVCLDTGPASSGGAWGTSPMVAHFPAGNEPSELPLHLLPDGPGQGWRALAVAWEAEDARLLIFEAEPEPTLAQTQAWAAKVPGELDFLAHSIEKGLSTTYLRGLMPPGEPVRGEPMARVAVEGDELRIGGRVHASQAGQVWARLLVGKVPYREAEIALATRERLGWSLDPGELFLFDSRLPLADDLPAGFTIQVWHLGGGAEPELLLEVPPGPSPETGGL